MASAERLLCPTQGSAQSRCLLNEEGMSEKRVNGRPLLQEIARREGAVQRGGRWLGVRRPTGCVPRGASSPLWASASSQWDDGRTELA